MGSGFQSLHESGGFMGRSQSRQPGRRKHRTSWAAIVPGTIAQERRPRAQDGPGQSEVGRQAPSDAWRSANGSERAGTRPHSGMLACCQ